MQFIGKKWKFVAIIYFIVSYLYVMVVKQMPLSTLLLFYAGFVVLTIVLFLGSSIGLIGLLVQSVFKNDNKAVKYYHVAYALKTNNISILTSYGLILLKDNSIKKALEIFKKTLTLKPYFLVDKIVKCNIAICHWKLGEVDEAIAMYEKIFVDYAKAVDEDDEDDEDNDENTDVVEADELIITTNSYVYAQDYTTLGFLYLLKKDYEKALENSKKALLLDENHAPALDNLGQIYYQMKEYDQAKEYLKKALEINPNMADSNYYMGLVCEEQGNLDEARKYYEITASCRINALNTVNREDVEEKLKRLG